MEIVAEPNMDVNLISDREYDRKIENPWSTTEECGISGARLENVKSTEHDKETGKSMEHDRENVKSMQRAQENVKSMAHDRKNGKPVEHDRKM